MIRYTRRVVPKCPRCPRCGKKVIRQDPKPIIGYISKVRDTYEEKLRDEKKLRELKFLLHKMQRFVEDKFRTCRDAIITRFSRIVANIVVESSYHHWDSRHTQSIFELLRYFFSLLKRPKDLGNDPKHAYDNLRTKLDDVKRRMGDLLDDRSHHFDKGDRVQVKYQGKWYKGTFVSFNPSRRGALSRIKKLSHSDDEDNEEEVDCVFEVQCDVDNRGVTRKCKLSDIKKLLDDDDDDDDKSTWKYFQRRAKGLTMEERRAMYASGKTSDAEIISALRKKKREGGESIALRCECPVHGADCPRKGVFKNERDLQTHLNYALDGSSRNDHAPAASSKRANEDNDLDISQVFRSARRNMRKVSRAFEEVSRTFDDDYDHDLLKYDDDRMASYVRTGMRRKIDDHVRHLKRRLTHLEREFAHALTTKSIGTKLIFKSDLANFWTFVKVALKVTGLPPIPSLRAKIRKIKSRPQPCGSCPNVGFDPKNPTSFVIFPTIRDRVPPIEISTIRISCSSSTWQCGKNFAGLILYSLGVHPDAYPNGRRLKPGYVLIKSSDEIASESSSEGQVHGNLVKHFFKEEPASLAKRYGVVFGGFGIVNGHLKFNSYTLNHKDNLYQSTELGKAMSENEEILCTRYVEFWKLYGPGKTMHTSWKDPTDSARDIQTFNQLLLAHVRGRDMKNAEKVFGRMKRQGIEPNTQTFHALIRGYACEQDTKNAERVLHLMEQKVRSSNVVCGNLDDSNLLLAEYVATRIKAKREELERKNAKEKAGTGGESIWTATYNLLLKAYENDAEGAERVFKRMASKAIQADTTTYNMLMLAYANCQLPDDAAKLLERMQNEKLKADISTFNTLAFAYARVGNLRGAMDTCKRMEIERIEPNMSTYTLMMKGFAAAENRDAAEFVVGRVMHTHQPNVEIYNALLSIYAKKLDVDGAEKVLIRMEANDSATGCTSPSKSPTKSCDRHVTPNVRTYKLLKQMYEQLRHSIKKREAVLAEHPHFDPKNYSPRSLREGLEKVIKRMNALLGRTTPAPNVVPIGPVLPHIAISPMLPSSEFCTCR